MREHEDNEQRHTPERAGAEPRDHRQEVAFVLTPAGPATRVAEASDAYVSTALLLARLSREIPSHGDGLRRFELVWIGGPHRTPRPYFVGWDGAADAPVVSRRRGFSQQAAAALAATSPLRWQAVTGRAARRAVEPLTPVLHARLRLGERVGRGVEIYPFQASSVEWALEHATGLTAVRTRLLELPRRVVVSSGDNRIVVEDGGWSAGATTGTADRMPPSVPFADPAMHWMYGVQMEVESEDELSDELLAVLANDFRGSGPNAIELVLRGRATPVDASWVIWSGPGGPGEAVSREAWRSTTAFLNLREAACALPVPVRSRDVASVLPPELAAIPAGVARTGWTLGTAIGSRRRVCLSAEDRLRHLYVSGQTGTGKSTLLENLVIQDFQDPEHPAVILVDAHNAFLSRVMDHVPADRVDDVLYFDPVKAPIAFNPMAVADPADHARVVETIIGLLQSFFDPGHTGIVGPRFEHAARSVLLTLLPTRGTTLADVVRLMTDDDEAAPYLKNVTDPNVLRYWKQRHDTSDFHKSETLDYFISKFSRFVVDPRMRAVTDHPTSKLDFDRVIRDGLIVCLNLDKGALGPDLSYFLGRMLLPALQDAGMRRGAFPGTRPRPICLYVDEAQNFAGPALEQILAEGRKYRLSVVLANQHAGQLPRSLVEAIIGNVGSVAAFRLGAEDAGPMTRVLGAEPALARTLTSLPNFHALARVLGGGGPQQPFLLASPKPLPDTESGRAEEVKKASWARFDTERA